MRKVEVSLYQQQKSDSNLNERAFLRRINRRLAKEGQQIKRCAFRSKHYSSLGRYYSVDIYTNCVTAQHIDLDEWGKEFGILATQEKSRIEKIPIIIERVCEKPKLLQFWLSHVELEVDELACNHPETEEHAASILHELAGIREAVRRLQRGLPTIKPDVRDFLAA